MPARLDDDVRRKIATAAGEAGTPGAEAVAMPTSVERLAAVVAVCSNAAIPFEVTSAVPRDSTADAGVLVSLSRLREVSVHAGSMTVRAEAGAEMPALRRAVEEAGRGVVGLPGTTDAHHVGSLIARGEVPRRSITGIELVLSTGEVVVTGGRVLKDVAGYELAGLALGSLGMMAVIVAVTLRLQSARAGSVTSLRPRITAGRSRAQAAMDPGGLLRLRR